ncbi:Tda4p NDAI_0D00310 [Naumovozyma dairenensis CBS 421]|uniref:TLC domain-containing protein n=1 Tax=Naumovozyma dairenensis (strain ATCC 10597 / BCRC 20456 / CBS 421 / NBRC 0211 / NRRL Y-12639) TaxID=1071378 RepID=G0W984_NAUDC|nr:hypothetical protein NDAI_0D00310 [Naumovozyma dairenensis CBS 421]CCD24345.1 hypothetical protein NDAI_0D00310 [Naumovozyma dairenensis CBS 421]
MTHLGKDPFMELSWFPESDSLYLSHAHEIVYSFLFYLTCSALIAPMINKFIFGKHYTSIKDKNIKIDFNVHTVSMIQAIISMIIIYPTLFLPNDNTLNITTYHHHYTSMVASLTLGYFIWDLLVCLKHFKLYGFQFLGHAVGALYVMIIALKPFCQPWIGKFVLYEASTPFVNINWFIIQLTDPITKKCVIPTWVNVLNGLMLLVVFFLVRIAWGTLATLMIVKNMWHVKHQIPLISAFILMSINVLLNGLNFVWFSKMIKIAKKLAGGSSSSGKIKQV